MVQVLHNIANNWSCWKLTVLNPQAYLNQHGSVSVLHKHYRIFFFCEYLNNVSFYLKNTSTANLHIRIRPDVF